MSFDVDDDGSLVGKERRRNVALEMRFQGVSGLSKV